MKRFLFMTALSAAMSIGDVAFAIDDTDSSAGATRIKARMQSPITSECI